MGAVHKKLSILFWLASLFAVAAISDAKGQATTITGTGRTVKINGISKVHLRWLPTGDTLTANSAQPDYYLNAWSRYKREGYVIKRRRMSGSNVLPTVEYTETIPPPDSLGLLQASNSTGPDAEAAGILFGALFDEIETSPGQISGKDIEMVSGENSDERAQRYPLTAIGTELSFPAAKTAGLGWVDNSTSIIAGNTYEYEITELGAASSGQTGKSIKVVVKNTYTAPSAPPAPRLSFGDKKSTLRWRWFLPGIASSSLTFQNVYSSYSVEKSATTASSGFSRVNARPIMSLNDSSDSLYFEVPLPANNVTTYFRIVGRSAYGEEVVSSIASGKGVEPPATWLPRIDSTVMLSGGGALLRWVFPSDTVLSQANTLLNGFEVYRSANLDNFQKQTIGGVSLLPATTRQVTLSPAQGNGYFMVTAKYKAGHSISSAPVLIQRVDSLPPAVPTGLQAIWEAQSGRVRLNWINNIESDLLGYKVFRANLANEEPALLADVRGSVTYLDTVLRVDNPKAWYYVLAYDQRFNQSSLSPARIIIKPDLTAPASPNIIDGQPSLDGVDLSWNNSASSDVAIHTLIRKPTGSSQAGTVLRKWNPSSPQTTYADRSLAARGMYTYVVQATDSAGNVSRDSILVDFASLVGAKPAVTDFTARDESSQGVRLTWACQGKEVVQLEITRVTDDNTLTLTPNRPGVAAPKSAPSIAPGSQIQLWKTLDGLMCGVWDREIIEGYHQRTYTIRAVYSDGSKSGVTQVSVEVN